MELSHLRYFEALASTLNVTRAAEPLRNARPPLSRQIQHLEDELGVTLIDRSSRPLALTRAGSFFFEQSAQILARTVSPLTDVYASNGLQTAVGLAVAGVGMSIVPASVQAACGSATGDGAPKQKG